MDVLIVGAGPTGLTAAVALARRGILPTLIERRAGPSPLSRAVGILPSSMAIFADFGIERAVAAEAVRFGGILFHEGARRLARLPLNFDDRSRIWGLAQDRTEAHLRAAFEALGGSVHYGEAFVGLRQSGGRVTVETSAGTATWDHVIGADGVQSAVRGALGIGYPGHELPHRWSIADVEAEGWSDPTFFKGYILPGDHVCVVVPMAPARFRVIASRPDALAALPVPMAVTRINRTDDFVIAVRQAERYQDGRVALAGDAAHAHSPVGGRGMNLGIADAAELARRIAEGGLDGYTAARHPEGARVIALSERARRMLQGEGPLPRAAVPIVMRAADRIPPLGRALMRVMASG